MKAGEALQRLKDGNERFASGVSSVEALASPLERDDLLEGQSPFAVILGCSDSRVPAERVFDQGVGDLFVIRVAGNVVGPSPIGSVEYAVAYCGTRLVVVLGHSRCGAVTATLEAIRSGQAPETRSIAEIVSRIRPAVEGLLHAEDDDGIQEILARAVRANVRHAVEGLRSGSPLLERLIREDGLRVVGAEYALETGRVEFLSDEDLQEG